MFSILLHAFGFGSLQLANPAVFPCYKQKGLHRIRGITTCILQGAVYAVPDNSQVSLHTCAGNAADIGPSSIAILSMDTLTINRSGSIYAAGQSLFSIAMALSMCSIMFTLPQLGTSRLAWFSGQSGRSE